ncbi:hypothetical protein D3H65_20130 [Paraflavitalea soli]|uniref:Uncharacterized protein n=1 Tax=Paraflavitalea soli TaxID=2315862 RepID=A0A3B7MWU8_9BACT|nr:hypothetical protein D3H65_20130 [Paraflavitalea soli]
MIFSITNFSTAGPTGCTRGRRGSKTTAKLSAHKREVKVQNKPPQSRPAGKLINKKTGMEIPAGVQKAMGSNN